MMLELNNLNLPLNLNDAETKLMVETAVSWIERETTFRFETAETVPANVKLFIVKYCGIMERNGIASESIAGMSQTFDTGNSISAQIAALAGDLLAEYGYSACKFFPARRRWSC